MKSISIVTSDFYAKDRLFDPDDPISNRDNCLEHLIEFRYCVDSYGFEVHTSDVLSPEEADLVFYLEMPGELPVCKGKKFLFLYESEVIRKDNWNLKRHSEFDKIFTWNDDLIDGKRYFKLNFLVPHPKVNYFSKLKTGFLTQISANKLEYHTNELYSERVEAIRWWERFHSSEFRFYGHGWNTPVWGKRFWKLNRRDWSRSLAPKFKSYGGEIVQKLSVLSEYKFSLCFENAFGYPGYITEKIFDCFFAGTIPIYWGPPNITQHIPADCFIDRTKFNSYRELRQYLVSMSDGAYQSYLKNIAAFLESPAMRPFYSSAFSEAVIPHLR